ncbi:MAG: cadherin-like beta sandwich domain-containing protein [Verrucomicrobiaceae bacterium]|nr:cadherin-like beta sandwich domain-containing protein [Verrucomicrobiaceae bacterium]
MNSISKSETVHFTDANTIPLTSSLYTASGPLQVTLDFAPPAGTVLKLVNHTGAQSVSGTFTNVPEGGLVVGLQSSTPHNFELTYAGGDGNDITLTQVSEVVTFPPIGVKYIDDAPFSLNATSSGSSTVTYEIVAGTNSAYVYEDVIYLGNTPGAVTVKAVAGSSLPKYQTFRLEAAGSGFLRLASSKMGLFSLGIRANGTLWGWGNNDSGQLGNGVTGTSRTPVQSGTATNWRQVSAGLTHAVGTRTDGSLWAWGKNNLGQVGQGTANATLYTTATRVGSDIDWAWAVAGFDHCIAVKTNGTLWAWGANNLGQCGQGDITPALYASPVQIGTDNDWRQTEAGLSAGGDFTLALKTSGLLWAWGDNTNGQLGDGTTTMSATPVQITAGSWNAVSAGYRFSIAILFNGTVWSWGANGNGQLGRGGIVSNTSSPNACATSTLFAKISAGGLHALGLALDGTLWSWGNSVDGQLGLGLASPFPRVYTPTKVGSAQNWSEIAAGMTTSHATTTDGGLQGWGSNALGQIGWLPRLPLPVQPLLGPLNQTAAGRLGTTAMIRPDGTLWALGSNSYQLGLGGQYGEPLPVATQVPGTQSWRKLSAGYRHTMAIASDGSLWGFGSNTAGQLGNGTTTASNSPVQIGTDTDWAVVSASSNNLTNTSDFTLAVKTDGSLWAWGDNSYGQFGNGTTTGSLTPVRIGTENDWATVFDTAGGHSLASKTNQTLWAWGLNSSGQIGNNTSTNVLNPVQVLSDVKIAVGGTFYSMALKWDGSLYTWGSGSSGQLGVSGSRLSPYLISGTWKSIASTNGSTSLGIKNDDSLWVWGYGFTGQLGNGTYSASSTVSPIRIGTSNSWARVISNGAHPLALTKDGTLWGWGEANRGSTGFAGHDQLQPDQVFPALSAPQTLSFFPPSGMSVGDTVTLNAQASSGLPPRYIVNGDAVLNGDRLTVTGPGTISVIAYQPGDRFWQASDMRQVFIQKASPIVTLSPMTNITATSAVLHATINPNGVSSEFRYTINSHPPYLTKPLPLFAPSGRTAETVIVPLSGLPPGTWHTVSIQELTSGGWTTRATSYFETAPVLSDLTVSSSTLSPAFDGTTYSYTLQVPLSTTSIDLSATAAAPSITLLKLGQNNSPRASISSGVPVTLQLNAGLNDINILCDTEQGHTWYYSIHITRAASFEQWRSSTGITGTTSSGPLDDFDGDGIANVLEYTFGTPGASGVGNGPLVVNDSTLMATGQPTSMQRPPPGGGTPVWCAVFIRRKDHAQVGLQCTPSFSVDLNSWQDSTDTPIVIADDGIYQALWLPYPEISGQAAHFFRLQVTLAP